MLLARFRPALAPALCTFSGVVVMAIAGVMFFENVLSQSLPGVDLPQLHNWLKDGNPHPGRMAPNTSVGFLLIGFILLLSHRVRNRQRALAVQTLTFFLLFIGITGLVGHFLQLDLLYGFQASRMPVNSALGLVLVSMGLWSHWFNADWYHAQRYFNDADKIVFVGSALLVVVALAAGVAGFAAQQGTLEKVQGENLAFAIRNQAALFQLEVDQGITKAKLTAARPTLLRLIHVLQANPADRAARDELEQLLDNTLEGNGGGIAIYDTASRELVRMGQFMEGSELDINLGRDIPAFLRWKDKFLLSITAPLSLIHI